MLLPARFFIVSGALLLAAAIACQQFVPGFPDFLLGVLYGVAVGVMCLGVVRTFRPECGDDVTPAVRRRYVREMLPAMLAYIAAVFASVSW